MFVTPASDVIDAPGYAPAMVKTVNSEPYPASSISSKSVGDYHTAILESVLPAKTVH